MRKQRLWWTVCSLSWDLKLIEQNEKRGKSGICMTGEHTVSPDRAFNTPLNSSRLRDEEQGVENLVRGFRIEQKRIF